MASALAGKDRAHIGVEPGPAAARKRETTPLTLGGDVLGKEALTAQDVGGLCLALGHEGAAFALTFGVEGGVGKGPHSASPTTRSASARLVLAAAT